jgi:hypothetical protein
MKKLQIGPVVIMLLFSLFSTVLAADDLPKHLRAKGNADTTLSGIDVYKSTVKEVIAKIGQPTRAIDVPDTGTVAGGRNYEWEKGGLKLICGTWNDKGEDSVAYSVEVWGTDAGSKLGVTGRGLGLGATLSDIHRIYGQRMQLSSLEHGDFQVTIQWNDDTTLYLFLNNNRHIYHIHLLASTE